MSDQQFFNCKFPFITPNILLNKLDISEAEIVLMHTEDAVDENGRD